MSVFLLVGLVAGGSVIGLLVLAVRTRRNRPGDLGSVSAAWTTEHSIGYRGGDGSPQ